MKSIGVVTNSNSRLAKFLKRNLEIIFEDLVNINNYYIDELEDDYIIKDDVVLFMEKGMELKCKRHIVTRENIIVIERTIKGSELYKLFTLPKGTKLLVVNNSKQTTLDTVYLLYQLGVNNLELLPYEEGKNFDDIKVALTPDEEEKVPKSIKTIINIGHRCIDTSTFIKIINKLNIEHKELSERLINYSESIISLNEGIKKSYKELFVKKEELDIVINLSKDGILFIDTEENIIFYNKAFKHIFNLEEVKDKKLQEVLEQNVLKIFRKESIKDDILEFKDRYLNINKQTVTSFGQNIGFYFDVQEVTYIKQLEQNLSKKLRNKGLIAKYNFDYIKTNSQKMNQCINLAKKVANSDLTVLITGESGTGKELLAQSIHNASGRANQPFVAVNCAALPENLLESELFGYAGGAFTGALKEGKIGLFEQAHNGTIFLDEVGDMPISLQTRMLRVLQERQIMRVGSQNVIDINVRVIAATNRNLLEMIDMGEFREDLFYRLNVLPINIPPLRERKEDIILVLESYINGKKNLKISEEVKDILLNYNWRGNIRELQNIASYIEIMSKKEVTVESLPFYLIDYKDDFEKEFSILEEKCEIILAWRVIKIIEERNTLNMGIGRKSIEETLKASGYTVTEAEIRKILEILNDLKITSSNLGRGGSKLTIKGENFIKWLNNRINH